MKDAPIVARHPNPCAHKEQGVMYGAGYRLMNPIVVPNNAEPAYRCTVCAPLKVHSSKRGGFYPLSQLAVKR